MCELLSLSLSLSLSVSLSISIAGNVKVRKYKSETQYKQQVEGSRIIIDNNWIDLTSQWAYKIIALIALSAYLINYNYQPEYFEQSAYNNSSAAR